MGRGYTHAGDYLNGEVIARINSTMKHDGWTSYHGLSFIKHDGTTVRFASYSTFVCSFDSSACILRVTLGAFDYSRTTCKHISQFLSDFVECDYKEVKKFIITAIEGEITEIFSDRYGDIVLQAV